MNSEQKDVARTQLNSEKDALEELKANYNAAIMDIDDRLKELYGKEQTQAVVYQEGFQKQLKAQLEDTLQELKDKNVNSVQGYLNTVYEDGYGGVLYDLSKNVTQITTPISAKNMAASVKYSAEHIPISRYLYKNVNKFAKQIQTAVSTGIAAGSRWKDVAIQIASAGESNMRHSFLIARTEGARVQSEAESDAQKDAKDRGLDIVKQWDSTMDSRTRPDHVLLDGQVREIGEKFQVNGHEADGPCQFGMASEDIQCRCKSVTRPRWAVDGNWNKRDQESWKAINTDDSESYAEWKKLYQEDFKLGQNVDLTKKTEPVVKVASTKKEARKATVDRIANGFNAVFEDNKDLVNLF